MSEKIGVYICNCKGNISEQVDIEELSQYAKSLDSVAYVKSQELLCSVEGKEFLQKDILAEKPTRIVIAACSPKEHEITFRSVCQKASLNPYLFQMINIREQVAWTTPDRRKATEKAKTYIRAAVKRVLLHEALEKKELDCNTDALVIGAGPAGMKAALLLAQAGRKVYLVEKTASIGGKAVSFEDVYPKLECAACMLEPKMDEVLHHENIELLIYSEVQEVVGFLGNFVAKIKKKARYVNEKCIGCGLCYEACPVKVKNEFDYNLSERKAISVPYAGALPNIPVIDKNTCVRFQGQDCKLCQEACRFQAIDYDQHDEIVEKQAGGIVVATGYALFDPAGIPELGYGRLPEVYTSLEFERLLSSNGPTSGKIVTKKGKEPQSVAIVHCVGSRQEKYHNYCSGVCCLYALKFSHLIRKQLPGVEIHHVYSDWCLPGKGHQQFFTEIKNYDKIHFHHSALAPNMGIQVHDESMNISYSDLTGKPQQLSADIIVLCAAMIPAQDTAKIAEMLSLSRGQDGFLSEAHTKMEPVATEIEGVFISGAAQGPKDIQGSVAQGIAAAGEILAQLVPGRKLALEEITAEIDDTLCSGCKICISLCPYKAIRYDQEKKVSIVNDILCKGCGVCVAACPSNAAKAKHFTSPQICAEIEEVTK